MAKFFQNTFFKKHSVFIGLLLIGLLFRILFIEYQGLSNDELSAWYRTRFFDWTSFWNQGVKTGDMHPVFYQAFLSFWVRVFGDSEWAIRSTGLFFYLINSWLIYQISNRFFSKKTGLSIIALYTCLAFTIINTTFARPYNSGTFFLLLSFWSILEINRSEKRITGWHIGIIFGFLGAMTSHYFAFLTAGLIGITGLVYLTPKRKKDLLICGIIALIAFLPHWPVTNYQLNVGGLGWLPAPKINWLLHFIFLFLNYSWMIVSFCIVLLWILNRKIESKTFTREEKFAGFIFILTYLCAHLLSVFYTPILRDIVMLFILPFLLLFIFRKFGAIPDKKFHLFIFSFALIIGTHSIISSKLLEPTNFAVFREIGHKINTYDRMVGRRNYSHSSNYNNVGYINYYLNSPLSERIPDWSKPELVYSLANQAKASNKDYYLYSWSNSIHIPMYLEVVQKYFPKTIDQKTYFNSGVRLYSKKGTRKLVEIKKIIHYPHSEKSQSSDEFFGDFTINFGDLYTHLKSDEYLLIKSKGLLSSNTPLYFVAVAERNGAILLKEKEPVLYQAFDQTRLNDSGISTDFFIAFEIPSDLLPTDKLKFYFWNPEKQKVQVEKPRLYFIGK